ncbi:MAG: DinB family protein [Ginsengibacter sp.]
MKKLFFGVTFTLFSFCIYAQSESALIINSHVQKLENAKDYTIAVANLMPDSLYNYRPVPAEMSFGEQLIHITQNLYWLTSTYIAEVPNPYHPTKDELSKLDKDSIINLVKDAYDFAISSISKMEIKTLSKEFKFSGENLNKYQFLNLIEDHQTHHRAQIVVYLRLNGIKPPKYIGW